MNNIELKRIRKRLSLKQPEMADLLYISLRKYQYFESGENEIDAETANLVNQIVIEKSNNEGVDIKFTEENSPFFHKNKSIVTDKEISAYVVRNIDKFKEDIVFKNLIDKEALLILLKAKKGDTIDIDLIGK